MPSSALEELYSILLDGNSMLFLGAGFTASSATNMRGSSVPGSSQLIASLLQSIGELPTADDSNKSLADVADYCFSSDTRRSQSVQRLREEFTLVEQSKWHSLLLTKVPWKRIYTTNYDNAIELAFSTEGKKANAYSAMSKFAAPHAMSTTCVHVNGMVGRIDPSNVDDELRLSNLSYAKKTFEDSEWSDLLANDLAYCDRCVFVGFSMRDLDISRLAISQQTRGRVFFFNGTNTDRFAKARLESYGYVSDLTGEQLANAMAEGLSTPRAISAKALAHFRRLRPAQTLTLATDNDRFSLLLYGDLKPNVLANNWQNSGPGAYVFARAVQDEILEAVEQGNDIAIISGLGNGKTTLLAILGYQLSQKGWQVFECVGSAPGAMAEVETLCSNPSRKIVLIDDASNNRNIVAKFGLHRDKNIRLVLADRTMRYDRVFTDDFLVDCGINSIEEYVLDSLLPSEISSLTKLFDSAGLWGPLASLEANQKRYFIEKKCRSELSIALLAIAKSTDLRNRVEDAFNADLIGDKGVLEALVVSAVLKVFGFSIPLHTLGRLVGTRAVEALTRSKSEVISKLCSVNGGQLTVHSAVFGSFLLRDVLEPGLVLGLLEKAAIAAQKHNVAFVLEEFEDRGKGKRRTASELYVFRNLQQIVTSEGNEERIFEFYEKLRIACSLEDEPLYWLQYAIAKLFAGEMETTKRFLDMAYGAAKKSTNFSPFQIDNQYARYLLETTIETGSTSKAYEAFSEAHRIVLDQVLAATHHHYPFRVATRYYDFIAIHRHALTPEQLEFIGNAVDAIRARLPFAKVPLDKQFWIDVCSKKLEKAKLLLTQKA
jgi:hypothetical protein